MKYITNVALAVGGERHDRGSEIELTSEQAAMYDPEDITAVDSLPLDMPAEDEQLVTVEEMSLTQLKDRAKELGVSTSGSKADLQERIALAENADGDDDNEAGLNPVPAEDDINNPIP